VSVLALFKHVTSTLLVTFLGNRGALNGPETTALFDSSFGKHFKAGVFGLYRTYFNIKLIFNNNNNNNNIY